MDILINDSPFIRGASTIALWLVVILLINVVHIGGNGFVLGINSFSAFVIAASAAGYAANVRLKMKDERLSDLAWLSMIIGFGLWAVAEAFRLIYMLILQNTSFLALNWFWLAGYLPFLHGLYERYQEIENAASREQRRLIWAAGGLGLLFIIGAEILPVISQAAGVSIANIVITVLYSLLDLVLLIGTLRVALTYQGIFSSPWWFFASGLTTKIIGEVVLLFPGQLATGSSGLDNFLLSFVNFAHYNWYAFAVLGIFVYAAALRHKNAPSTNPESIEEKTPNANALVFTDKDDIVIRTSLNFRYLLRLPSEMDSSQIPLLELLGISESAYNEYKALLLKQGTIVKFAVEPAYLRQGQKAWLTSAVSYDSQKKYNGADIIVQVLSEGIGGAALTSEERAVAENIFWRTGSQGEDSFKLLVDYFNTNYKMLSALASEYESSKRAAGLSEAVNQVANKQKIAVNVLEQQINVKTTVKLEELAPVTVILLNTARAYVSKLAGPEIVRRETERLNREADLSTKKLIERYNLTK